MQFLEVAKAKSAIAGAADNNAVVPSARAIKVRFMKDLKGWFTFE
jgi:hypothetical protein